MRRVLRRKLERFTGDTIVDPASLREQLREVREEGFAFTVEELEVGLNAVGAPIRCARGALVGAVSVSGPAFRLPPDSIPKTAGAVRNAAADISRCLGFRA